MISSDQVTNWFDGKVFTTDWTSRAFETWSREFDFFREKSVNILEIGSWEGRSSLFFLNFFPNSILTCIDIFSLGNEALFDSNVMLSHSSRVKKIVGRSASALDSLVESHTKFDLIYIDGSHDTDDVLIDSLISWKLLANNGIIVWDDYELCSQMRNTFYEYQDPKPAIDFFTNFYKNELKTIHIGYQYICQRIAPRYLR